MNDLQWKLKTAIGELYLVATTKGLKGIYWNRQDVPMTPSLSNASKAAQILLQTTIELEQYFNGQRTEFQIPLDYAGTKFQEQVWKQLLKIPFGQTISYKELAKRIKNAKAVRAVGSANGKNPLTIIVPCHRVIASDGELGGYAGGLKLKKKLLDLEKQFCI